MARRQKHPAVFIMLSPAMLATACAVHPSVIAEGIERGLPVYQHGAKRRVLVSEWEDHVRAHWKQASAAKQKRKIK